MLGVNTHLPMAHHQFRPQMVLGGSTAAARPSEQHQWHRGAAAAQPARHQQAEGARPATDEHSSFTEA